MYLYGNKVYVVCWVGPTLSLLELSVLPPPIRFLWYKLCVEQAREDWESFRAGTGSPESPGRLAGREAETAHH